MHHGMTYFSALKVIILWQYPTNGSKNGTRQARPVSTTEAVKPAIPACHKRKYSIG